LSVINLPDPVPPKSTLANLDALNVDGSRQSVPVTKKTKKDDKVADVSKKTIGNSTKSKTISSFGNSSKNERISLTSRPRALGSYLLDEKGRFKRLTPINMMNSMKCNDPRSEKLTIESLKRRFGVVTNENMESVRSAFVTRSVELGFFFNSLHQ
jgi:hypothetical protein